LVAGWRQPELVSVEQNRLHCEGATLDLGAMAEFGCQRDEVQRVAAPGPQKHGLERKMKTAILG
jgi:hypothetical protein